MKTNEKGRITYKGYEIHVIPSSKFNDLGLSIESPNIERAVTHSIDTMLAINHTPWGIKMLETACVCISDETSDDTFQPYEARVEYRKG